jgi:hypothetical protein
MRAFLISIIHMRWKSRGRSVPQRRDEGNFRVHHLVMSERLEAVVEEVTAGDAVGDVISGASGTKETRVAVGAANGGKAVVEAELELGRGGGHAAVVADVVLGQALGGEAGHGVAGQVARDAQLALEQGLGLLDGFFLRGDGRARLVVVVAAEEDEELGAGLRTRLGVGADANLAVDEDAQRALRVALTRRRRRNEVAQARRGDAVEGVPQVDRHDTDALAVLQGGQLVSRDACEVLRGQG